MRAMVVREYGAAPVLCEVAGPAGPAADVLAASLNPVATAVAAGLNPFRRPELALVLGLDGVARLADGALVHVFWPAVPYGTFAERVPLADAETVPLPAGLDASRAAALGISGVAAWTALAGTAALQPGESVLVLGANGQVGRIAVQAARLLGAHRVTAVVQHEAARQTPQRLGAGTVVTSQDLPTLTERLLEADQQGYDVILDTLRGPVIPAAVDAAATGARVVHLGNSARALATLAGPGDPHERGRHPGVRDFHVAGAGTLRRLRPAGAARHGGGTDRRIPRNRTGRAPGHLGRRRGRTGENQDHRHAEPGNPLMTAPARARRKPPASHRGSRPGNPFLRHSRRPAGTTRPVRPDRGGPRPRRCARAAGAIHRARPSIK
jgi:NADPH:quinone reductase-like Zn-dependent oxidoreductase